MRVFYLILSIYVIMLSVIPCCEEESCCDDIKTEQTMNQHHRHECSDSCSSGACSPFLTCGSCAGFVSIDNSARLQPQIFFVKKQIIPFEFGQTINYYSQYWQPPRLMGKEII